MNTKKIRKRLELTKAEFARRLGVTWMTVYRWESGKSNPDPRSVRDIEALIKEKQV